jgi:hypothetical protein
VHQPITSSLKRCGYRSGLNPQHKKTLKQNDKANYYQPIKYFSDLEAGEIDYQKDYHTPTDLVDHKYLWHLPNKSIQNSSGKRATFQRYRKRSSNNRRNNASTRAPYDY